MDRVEFTDNITILLRIMIEWGERPILDWVKRSEEEQKRLFECGKSRTLDSRHLQGKAADIYFLNKEGTALVDPINGWDFWHERWEDLGGKPMLDWDKGHFE